MKAVETDISWGFLNLVQTFFEANSLKVTCVPRGVSQRKITVEYEDNSDTAMSITFMSTRHLGFENMLCDYLKRCGVPVEMMAVGNSYPDRDMKKLDADWEKYRKEILKF